MLVRGTPWKSDPKGYGGGLFAINRGKSDDAWALMMPSLSAHHVSVFII